MEDHNAIQYILQIVTSLVIAIYNKWMILTFVLLKVVKCRKIKMKLENAM